MWLNLKTFFFWLKSPKNVTNHSWALSPKEKMLRREIWHWHICLEIWAKVKNVLRYITFIKLRRKKKVKVNVHRVPWWFFQLNSKASPVCLTLGLCHKFLLGLTPCHLSTVFKHFFFLLRLRLKWMAFLTPRKGERKVKIWFLNPNHM